MSYNYLWIKEDLNFGEYVRKLRKKSQFIKNNQSRDESIYQHCIEQLNPQFAVTIQNIQLEKLIDVVCQNRKEEICSSAFNINMAATEKRKEKKLEDQK